MELTNTIAALTSLKSALATHGFLLCDAKSVKSLPESVWLEPYPKRVSQPSSTGSLVESHCLKSGSLLLIGHAGKKFWESFSQVDGGMQKPDPVDSYSAELTEKTIEKYLPQVAKQLLFPMADCPVNLMALGRAFNWHTTSPLGMGIHAEYGLWSAYRAVWWLDLELPDVLNQSVATQDICAKCLTQDCVTACPSGAITYSKHPDLNRCADYRLENNSQCESTCLARMACPHAEEHRYTEPQMRYHYELARSAIMQYRSKS